MLVVKLGNEEMENNGEKKFERKKKENFGRSNIEGKKNKVEARRNNEKGGDERKESMDKERQIKDR